MLAAGAEQPALHLEASGPQRTDLPGPSRAREHVSYVHVLLRQPRPLGHQGRRQP